jgi:hypothetical protein
MMDYHITLVSEGSSDRMLEPLLRWLITQCRPNLAITMERADLGRLPKPPKRLCDKLSMGYKLYPCDLILVHRDADKVDPGKRRNEVIDAAQQAQIDNPQIPPSVPVIPVRMSEAWLLIDEPALRKAAGNPRGRETIQMPALKSLEALTDPKQTLQTLLLDASATRGRKRRNFDIDTAKFRLAELIDHYEDLRQLPAFQRLETDIQAALPPQHPSVPSGH